MTSAGRNVLFVKSKLKPGVRLPIAFSICGVVCPVKTFVRADPSTVILPSVVPILPPAGLMLVIDGGAVEKVTAVDPM
jgi:hypothetical protein